MLKSGYKLFKLQVILTFLSSFCYLQANCQTYNFTNVTVENGLSQPQVLCMFQDTDGTMWFGTNGGGITKFDGKNYEYITDKDGLVDNTVYCIAKDKTGSTLIGTSNGLSIYNGRSFKNFSEKDGLNSNLVFCILIDDEKVLIGTGNGVSVLQNNTFKNYPLSPSLNNTSVFNIIKNKNQTWFCTIGKGAFCFENGEVKHFNESNGLKANFVYSFFETRNKTWILTDEGIFDLRANHAKKIVLPKLPKETSCYAAYNFNNSVWIATSSGILKLKDTTTQLYTVTNGLVDNDIWKIFSDKENNLWFASKENGVSKLSNESFYKLSEDDGLLSNKILALYQDKKENYWIGTSKGLSFYNQYKIINYSQKDFKFDNEITAITEDNKGNILIGTTYGLIKFDGKNFIRYEAKGSNNGLNYIHTILADTKNEIWLGTKKGVAKLNEGTIEECADLSIPKNFVYKIIEDKNGVIWFGTENGLYSLNNNLLKRFSAQDGFDSKYVYSIILGNKDNDLWFGTNTGIYNYSNNSFSSLTTKNGLNSNDIISIAIEKNNILLAGVANGVDKIQIKGANNLKIKHFDSENGFSGGACTFNAILVDTKNKIWFGSENGLLVYQPEYDNDNCFEPTTRLKNIQLFGEESNWKEFSSGTDNNGLPIDLKLPFNKNYLTFNFIGVSQTTPTKVSYKYSLKGFDKGWLPETNKTEAVYSNIPPGNYEFLVIANNGEGVWNKNPVSFKFTIKPPFWQTWWFYSIIATIVISGIYSYIKIKSSNIKIIKQHQIIEQQNADLNKANLLIAEKNQNITDSINYAQRIQQSFLTSDTQLEQSLKKYFILYKPRDIVSGDFYWSFDLPDRTLIACADSTGHGIPGAFMSLIGISLLNEISHSKKMVEPSKILDELRRIIICALNPQELEWGAKDGMDIGLISIFKNDTSDEVKIHFSGGNHSLYISSIQKYAHPELLEFKGDKQPVGFYAAMKPFSQKEITAYKGDMLYLFTDGYADQFGGPREKKFMSKQLKKMLLNICHLPVSEQHQILNTTFIQWQGTEEQVDDVTIIGIKL